MAKSKKVFDGQHDDEDVVMVFRRHPVVMRKGFLSMMIFLLFGMIPIALAPTNLGLLWGIPVGLAIGAVVFMYFWIGWYFSVFVVTDKRFIKVHQKGLFNRSVVDLGLDKVQNINFEVAGFQQTMLGFGTIVVQTFVGDLVLDNVHHPEKTQEALIKVIKDSGYEFSGQEQIIEASQDG